MIRKLSGTIAIVAVFAAANGVFAQEPDRAPEKRDPSTYLLAKSLDGASVETKEGQSVGKIDELVVDAKSRKIVFAIVSTGGFLGIGDRLTAIPYELVQWRVVDETTKPYVELTRQNIRMAPAFEYKKLLDHLADEQWRDETRAAFGAYPKDAVIEKAGPNGASDESPAAAKEGAAKIDADRWRLLSDMTNVRIVADKDRKEGDVKADAKADPKTVVFADVADLVLDRKRCSIAAVVATRTTLPAFAEERVIVPYAALEKTARKAELRVKKTMKDMESAPRVEKAIVDRLENKEFRAGVESFFGAAFDD